MVEVSQISVDSDTRTNYILGKNIVTIIKDYSGCITVSSNLAVKDSPDDEAYNSAIDGVESLLMAMAGEDVDMNNKRIAKAVFVAVDGIADNI